MEVGLGLQQDLGISQGLETEKRVGKKRKEKGDNEGAKGKKGELKGAKKGGKVRRKRKGKERTG